VILVDSISGHLLLQLSMTTGVLPSKLDVDVHYLHLNKRKLMYSANNIVLLNLAFEGDATIRIEHPDIASKLIYIARLHSAPFPKKGGFCVNVDVQSKTRETALVKEELIKIYSEDYLEYYFVDANCKKQRRSIHNVEKHLPPQSLTA